MKLSGLSIMLVSMFLTIPSKVIGQQNQEVIINYNWPYLESKHIEFLGYDDSFRSHMLYVVDQEGEKLPRPDPEWVSEEIEKWRFRILLSVKVFLTEDFLDELVVKNNGPIKFLFYIDRRAWNNGLIVLEDNVICINLWPSRKRPDWMTWAKVVEDISEAEMMAFIFHEIGHIYSISGEEFDEFYKDNVGENVPTRYAQHLGKREDFADSFALYIMWRKYFSDNFHKRYLVMKNIIGVEHPSPYLMPISIIVRLTVTP